jgi:histidinol phosphatase-like enzyme
MDGNALFLDRDGVINVDRGYVHRPEQCQVVPGVFELARFWTNDLRRDRCRHQQSGIGRGYFDEKAYANLTRWMCDRFEAERTAIARVYHCPYHTRWDPATLVHEVTRRALREFERVLPFTGPIVANRCLCRLSNTG